MLILLDLFDAVDMEEVPSFGLYRFRSIVGAFDSYKLRKCRLHIRVAMLSTQKVVRLCQVDFLNQILQDQADSKHHDL